MRIPLLAALSLLLAASVAHAQNWEVEPTFGSVELSEGFLPDPHEVELSAGGTFVPDVEGCDFGYIEEAPTYDLWYGERVEPSDADPYYETSGGTDLYIYVVSNANTTILVNTPDASWVCDDDGFGDGETPLLIIPAALGGLYDIWVGTNDEEPAEATLFLSEEDPRTSE
jgi:hypothetical protein